MSTATVKPVFGLHAALLTPKKCMPKKAPTTNFTASSAAAQLETRFLLANCAILLAAFTILEGRRIS